MIACRELSVAFVVFEPDQPRQAKFEDRVYRRKPALSMPLVQFRAGRCERRAGTNWVDPSPAKGLVSLEVEDGLLHFQYKDLESNSTVDDLILFPGDATFSPVSPSSRVYVLRFTSSSARHFYWMQDVETTQDARRAGRVNALIEDVDAPEQQQDVASMEGVTS